MPYAALTQEKPIGDLKHLGTLFNEGSYEMVIENLEKFPASSRTSEHYRFLIYSYAEKDLDKAEAASELAIETLSNEPDVYLFHASIMGAQASESIFSSLSYAKKALASLNKAVELAPEDIKYREALLSFHLNAPSIAGGDTDLALEQIRIIEKLDLVQGTVNLAWYYQATDETDKALNVLLQADTDFPNNIAILNALANFYLSQEQHSFAIQSLEKITKISLLAPVEDELIVMEEYDEARFRQLNAHYQIGRAALLGDTALNEGISHMKLYIDTMQDPDAIATMDFSGLPSVDWAYLRLTGLLLANAQSELAKVSFAKVTLDNNDGNMKSIYKNLKKKLN
jgi:tetratricopeptide (TPR) repeat protein